MAHMNLAGNAVIAALVDETGAPITDSNPLAVNATVEASISGFTPNGNVANLSVTTSSANVALPAGVTVVVTNKGANTAFINLSVGAGSAATTDFSLVAGAAVGLTVGSNTYINAITASSTTTLNIAGGAGLATGYGGGSSSGGGGGGEVTNAGTFAVQLTGATNNINNVAGTVSLPTGASTAAHQVTAQTSLSSLVTNTTSIATAANQTSVIGTKAAGTAAASSALVGGVYNSGGVTLTNGQQAAAQMTSTGEVKVAGVGVAIGSTTSGQTLSPVGARTLNASPTDTTAQTNLPALDTKGRLLTMPYGHLSDQIQGIISTPMTSTTSTAVTGIGTPGSNLFNYITSIIISNSDADTDTDVELQDGNGGTSFAFFPAAKLCGGVAMSFAIPLKQPTANTALYAKNTTTGASTRVTVVGFKGP